LTSVLFGVRLPNSGPLATPKAVEDAAREAESLGYDSVWVHDHVVWNEHLHREHVSSGAAEALRDGQTPDFYESLTTLAYVAGITSKVKLGVAVLVAPVRNPVLTAKQLANIDVLSKGRLIVGVGIGAEATSGTVDYPVFNVRREERQERTDECIRAMQEIWTKPNASFTGKYVNFRDVVIYPKPVQKPYPPILIGGGGTPNFRRVLRRIVELGDGWIPGWLTPQEFKDRIANLKDISRKHGQGDKNYAVAVEINANVANSSDEAARNVRATVLSSKHTFERHQTVDEILERSLLGSPTDIIKQTEAFVQSGVSHFELRFWYPTLENFHSMMRRFAREIIPSFR
jgi:probable F420-dependent oxidoreductase